MKRVLQQRLCEGVASRKAVRAVLVSVDGDIVLSHYRDWPPSD